MNTQTTILETPGASAGAAGGGNSINFVSTPLLSSDGQFIAFASEALGLAPQAGDGQSNVYLRAVASGNPILVSQRNSSLPSSTAGSTSEVLAVSANGEFVVFASSATGLTPLGNSGQPQIYLRDLQTGVTQLVSVNASGTAGGNGYTEGPAAVSDNGTLVAFVSAATNLVPNFVDGHTTDADDPDVYVRNMVTGQTQLVSVNEAGTASGNAGSGEDFQGPALAISADGSQVVFVSGASNLVSNSVPANSLNIYDRNLLTGTTTLVSATTNGTGTSGGVTYLTGSGITLDDRVTSCSSAVRQG